MLLRIVLGLNTIVVACSVEVEAEGNLDHDTALL